MIVVPDVPDVQVVQDVKVPAAEDAVLLVEGLVDLVVLEAVADVLDLVLEAVAVDVDLDALDHVDLDVIINVVDAIRPV